MTTLKLFYHEAQMFEKHVYVHCLSILNFILYFFFFYHSQQKQIKLFGSFTSPFCVLFPLCWKALLVDMWDIVLELTLDESLL